MTSPEPTAPPVSPDPRRKKKLLRNLVLAVTFLGVIAAITVFFFRNTIREAYHERRGIGFAAKAMEAFEKEDWKEARINAAEAWKSAPDHPDVLRAMARIMGTNNVEAQEAGKIYKRLIASGLATQEDIVAAVELHLALGDLISADEFWQKLDETERGKLEVKEIHSRLLAAQGRVNEAKSAIMEISEIARVSEKPEDRLRGAVMEIQGTFPELEQRGLDTLWELGTDPSKTGLSALEALASRMNGLTTPERKKLISLLTRHPLAGDEHVLVCLSLEISNDPANKTQIIKREIESRLGQPLESLEFFFQWLMEQKEYETMTQLLTYEEAAKSEKIFPYYLSALVQLNQWDEMRKILEQKESLPLRPAQITLLEAISKQQSGADSSEVQEHIRLAFRVAHQGGDGMMIFLASQYAASQGMNQVASDGFDILTSYPMMRPLALEAKFRLANKTLDLESMIATSKAARTQYASNQRVVQQLAYLRLLSGKEIELAEADINDLAQNGDETPLRLLLSSFLHYRKRDRDQMKSVLGQIDAALLDPGPKAIMASLLRLSGDARGAFRISEKIPIILLLPEEKKALVSTP